MENCEVKNITKEGKLNTKFALQIEFKEQDFAKNTLKDCKKFLEESYHDSTNGLLRGIIKAIEK